ncbi:MAG: prephenate dehydrogenase [Spirochaetaceae bacterium]|nr:prephenate dehydrogenase [Spirochaetaceae bacterium]
MKPFEDCVTGIVGLGLMGGAIAMALRRIPEEAGRGGLVLACDIDGGTIDAALKAKLIDEGFTDAGAMLGRCDLLFLCLNPGTLLRFMNKWMTAFKSGALITDIAGIKGSIAETMEGTLREDLDFIPGHPMAGSEKGGFENAGSCNFTGRNYILTPLRRNKPEHLEFLRDLIRRMGFGRIVETTAEEHDRKIAFTSQLCHVIAAALIDCEADTAITRFGGGSFEDLTRIAMLNVPMWTELFLENRRELLRRIEQFEGSLGMLKGLIAGGEEGRLRKTLQAVRQRRSSMT